MKILRIVDDRDLEAKGIKFHRNHRNRLIKQRKFPRPIRLGEHKRGWIEAEIDAWIAERIAERDSAADHRSCARPGTR